MSKLMHDEFHDVADRSKLIQSSKGGWRDEDRRLERFNEEFPELDPMQDLYRNIVIVAFSLAFLSLGFLLGHFFAS